MSWEDLDIDRFRELHRIFFGQRFASFTQECNDIATINASFTSIHSNHEAGRFERGKLIELRLQLLEIENRDIVRIFRSNTIDERPTRFGITQSQQILSHLSFCRGVGTIHLDRTTLVLDRFGKPIVHCQMLADGVVHFGIEAPGHKRLAAALPLVLIAALQMRDNSTQCPQLGEPTIGLFDFGQNQLSSGIVLGGNARFCLQDQTREVPRVELKRLTQILS